MLYFTEYQIMKNFSGMLCQNKSPPPPKKKKCNSELR